MCGFSAGRASVQGGLLALVLAGLTAATALAQDVVVESETLARSRKGSGSAFLRSPELGDTRYDESIDWRAIPPSRQSSFYGVRARGTFFVFVVDCSGSMDDADRWVRVQRELRQTLRRLQFPQRYMVIFYNDAVHCMPGGLPQSADHAATTRTLTWASQVEPDGGTQPEQAMKLALGLHPNAVFLLSDGEYPDDAAEHIIQMNQGTPRVPVHCIDLSGGAAGTSLKQIADRSGGQYVTRSSQ